MNTVNEDRFVQMICSHLDTSIEHLDPALEKRLHRIREAALLPQSVAVAEDHANTVLMHNVRDSLQRDPPLPADIQAQLDIVRKLAVAKMQQRDSNVFRALHSRIRYGISSLLDMSQLARPANMLATACVLVTVVSLSYVSLRPAGTIPLDDEIALIASADDFELYENLDFYLWLAENGIPN